MDIASNGLYMSFAACLVGVDIGQSYHGMCMFRFRSCDSIGQFFSWRRCHDGQRQACACCPRYFAGCAFFFSNHGIVCKSQFASDEPIPSGVLCYKKDGDTLPQVSGLPKRAEVLFILQCSCARVVGRDSSGNCREALVFRSPKDFLWDLLWIGAAESTFARSGRSEFGTQFCECARTRSAHPLGGHGV
jgi:hypothetical protein